MEGMKAIPYKRSPDIYLGDNWIEEAWKLLVDNLSWKHRGNGGKLD